MEFQNLKCLFKLTWTVAESIPHLSKNSRQGIIASDKAAAKHSTFSKSDLKNGLYFSNTPFFISDDMLNPSTCAENKITLQRLQQDNDKFTNDK